MYPVYGAPIAFKKNVIVIGTFYLLKVRSGAPRRSRFLCRFSSVSFKLWLLSFVAVCFSGVFTLCCGSVGRGVVVFYQWSLVVGGRGGRDRCAQCWPYLFDLGGLHRRPLRFLLQLWG